MFMLMQSQNHHGHVAHASSSTAHHHWRQIHHRGVQFHEFHAHHPDVLIRNCVSASHPMNALPNLPLSVGTVSTLPLIDLKTYWRETLASTEPIVRVITSIPSLSSAPDSFPEEPKPSSSADRRHRRRKLAEANIDGKAKPHRRTRADDSKAPHSEGSQCINDHHSEIVKKLETLAAQQRSMTTGSMKPVTNGDGIAADTSQPSSAAHQPNNTYGNGASSMIDGADPKRPGTTSEALSTAKKRVRFRNRSVRPAFHRNISIIRDVFDPSDPMRSPSSNARLEADGLDLVELNLRIFKLLKNLSIGRTHCLKVKDLTGVEKLQFKNVLSQKRSVSQFQRPRKKPLAEYYNDDDAELEAMAKVVDPNAPKPEGSLVIPVRGEFPADFQSQTSAPKSIDSVLTKHATTQPKAIALAILDTHNKLSSTLTYGKLLSRSVKVAHLLSSKQQTVLNGNGQKEKVPICRVGDCVALIYPNTEPLAFVCAFYGCLLAGMVPVPVDVPTCRRDVDTQQFGFLLGSCGVSVALTTDSCLKGLPRSGSTSSNSSHFMTTTSGYATTTTGSSGSNGLASPSGSISTLGGVGTPSTSTHKDSSDVVEFKGWPRLHWLTTDHLSKPVRDFSLPSFNNPDDTVYVEYSTDREGSVKGVCVKRQSMIAHSRALAAAMNYAEGETMITMLDFKKDAGLWHLLSAIYCGMRTIFVPYSLMKANPTLWLTQVAKNEVAFVLLRARDLHWSLMASSQRDQKDNINLESLKAVIVADGANPWSLSSCDQFAQSFAAKGLAPNVICPCAGSPETGTIALRRPTTGSTLNSGRGILSMWALSHSVVRVNHQTSLNSLALQDAGLVIPGAMAIVVKINGSPKVCRVDEVGEICLHSPSTASSYFGLKGVSSQVFQVNPLSPDEKVLGSIRYVRSGLIGFLGPDGLIFVIGNRQSLMNISGRQHMADDIIATTLSVEPMKFIFRGRIAVFSVPVLRDERIVIVAEQKGDVNEEDSFNWMIRVLQAIDTIHQVGVYCLALVAPNQLPKASLGGVNVAETRRRFLDGNLHPATLLMCPQNCVLNLPKPREQQHNDVGPAAMFVGNIVQGVRIAGAEGRPLPRVPDEPLYLIDALRLRAQQIPDHILYTLVNAKGIEVENLTCANLWKKAERIGALLLDKGRLNPGDHVALIFAPGIDLITAFYGCLIVGLVPVCIRAPSPQNLHNSLITVRMVVDVSKSVALLSTSPMIKLLKSKEASHRMSTKAWPTILDINDTPSSSVARKRNQQMDQQLQKVRKATDTCYLDFAVSTTGQLAGVVMTHEAVIQQCKSLKIACELYPSRHVILCLDPYSGLGFNLWCTLGVYAGHKSTLIPPAEMEANALLWFQYISQHKARDTFCSYSVLSTCVRELASQVNQLKDKNISLQSLRNCIVVAEERPRFSLCQTFIRLFRPLGLSSRAVSTSFGSRVNMAICLQGASSPDPTTVYVDSRALRNDRVALVEKGAPHSVALMECGKLLPGVKVAIANPDTMGQCADSHLGEIWVASEHNAAGYYSIFAEETGVHTDHFNAKLRTGDTTTTYARTGFLGFLKRTDSVTADGGLHDAVFVVGALDETLMLRGMRYHPVDIESSVSRAHKRILESAVFTWTHLLVVVAETDAPESEALDLVPSITSRVLEEQHLIVGVVMIVDAHTIPINSRGEKQRMHLRDSFLKDQLDPIYVAYNM